MDYEHLIKHYKTQAAIARAVGITQPSVWLWKKRGVPIDRQIALEMATNGKLKADIPASMRTA